MKSAIVGTDFPTTGDIWDRSVGPSASCWPLFDPFPTKNRGDLSKFRADRAAPLCSGDKYYLVMIPYNTPPALCQFTCPSACAPPCSLRSATLGFSMFLPSLKMLVLTFGEGPPTLYPELLTPLFSQATITHLFCLWVGLWTAHGDGQVA